MSIDGLRSPTKSPLARSGPPETRGPILPRPRPLAFSLASDSPPPAAGSKRGREDRTTETALAVFNSDLPASRERKKSRFEPENRPSLPKPLQVAFTHDQVQQLQRKRSVCPPGPTRELPKSRTNPAADEQNQIELESWIHPSIIRFLVELKSNGQYKTAWEVHVDSLLPCLVSGEFNKDILVLTFKFNKHNRSAYLIKEHMKNSIKQYKQATVAFGEDRCVTIYNATTALEDKYFIVNKIERSLEVELENLKRLVGEKKLKPFESMEDLIKPLDANQMNALNLLRQLRRFYDKSIKEEIDTDIHIGNFRLEKDEFNNDKLLLADFRESIEEDDLIANKAKEFHEFKKDLGMIFSPKFLDEYFNESIEKRNRKASEIEFRIKEQSEEDNLLGISDLASSVF